MVQVQGHPPTSACDQKLISCLGYALRLAKRLQHSSTAGQLSMTLYHLKSNSGPADSKKDIVGNNSQGFRTAGVAMEVDNDERSNMAETEVLPEPHAKSSFDTADA